MDLLTYRNDVPTQHYHLIEIKGGLQRYFKPSLTGNLE